MLHRTRKRSGRRWLVAAAAVTLAGGALVAHRARASDHQDSPDVELNPSMDMTDVYAFPGSTPDRIALVLNSWAFLTPAETPSTSFDPNLLYQLKIDNTGDAREDKVLQLVFHGSGASQTVELRGPIAPPVVGAMQNRLSDASPVLTGAVNQVLGDASGVQLFAGARNDPFFIDLEQFFRVLPDRKPVGGPLSGDLGTATTFRGPGDAQDYPADFNVLSIVLELPTAMLTEGGNERIGIWGTISR